MERESAKKRRRDRHARGECANCGEKPLETKWECARCAKASCVRARTRQKEKIAAGLCKSCGGSEIVRSDRCLPCWKNHRKTHAACVARRVADGFCEKCVKKRAPGDTRYCKGHRKKANEYARRSGKKRRAARAFAAHEKAAA